MTKTKIKGKKKSAEGWNFIVKTNVGTVHDVYARKEYWRKLTDRNYSIEVLVKASFIYLLERESAEMILRNFDLEDIEIYFSDYPEEIKEYLK